MEDIRLFQVQKTFSTDFWKKPDIAISNLTFSIHKHQTTALIGHNGAGKTTLIKMLLGLVRPDQGKIFFGQNELSDQMRKKIGYMPEVHKIPQKMTPKELLSLVSKNEMIDSVLELCGLRPFIHKPIGKLSKGTKQRVSWAQAVIKNPDIYILDEPLSGLDPLWQKKIVDWIETEQKQNKTFLICSHEIHFLEQFCHKAVVLKKGHLCFDGNFSDFSQLKNMLEFFHV